MQNTRSDIPPPSSNVLDARGRMTEVWWQFLLLLWRRTGGGSGGDLSALVKEISDLAIAADATVPDAHTAALLERLNQLETAIAAEVTALSVRSDPFAGLEPVQNMSADPFAGLAPVSTHGIQEEPDLHAVATPERAGFMSAADKAKLDAL